MVEEKKSEKKVEVKEKPLGGTEVEKTEKQQVSEQPSTTTQARAENAASKGGETIGKGLKKVASVVGEFTAGVSKEMKPSQPPKQGEQAQQTEYRSEETERTKEAAPGKVVEKEKKVTKEKE